MKTPSTLDPANITTGLFTVTAAVAETLLELTYERQRKIRPGKVTGFARMLEVNDFLPGALLRFAPSNGSGSLVLVDGQHRLSAQVQAKRSVVCNVWVDEDDANTVYAKADTGGRLRNETDIVRALADQLPGASRMKSIMQQATARACRIISKRIHGQVDVIPSDIVAVWEEYQYAIRKFNRLHKESTHSMDLLKRFTTSNMAALIVYSLGNDHDGIIHDFWRDTLRCAGPSQGTTAHNLNMFFANRQNSSVKCRYAAVRALVATEDGRELRRFVFLPGQNLAWKGWKETVIKNVLC